MTRTNALFLAATLAFATAAGAATDAPRLSDLQRSMIIDYFRAQTGAAREGARHDDRSVEQAKGEDRAGGDDKDKGRGRGHAKDKGLPPGIAKNLERGKSLPPGIAKTRLPDDLTRKLPPAPKGHEIVMVDGRVLLIETATQVIRDKMEDAVLRR